FPYTTLFRSERLGGLGEAAGAEADHLVAPHEPVVVVEGLEVVQVAVDQGERLLVPDTGLDLGGDLEVPGQTGQRREVASGLRSPEHGAHPGRQLGDVERLGDVVVGPELETTHAIFGEAAGSEQDDRDVGGR